MKKIVNILKWGGVVVSNLFTRRYKIGFSVILADELFLDGDIMIGHFNYVSVHKLSMKKGSKIGKLNRIKGDIDVELDEKAFFDHKIVASGPNSCLTVKGRSKLYLGKGAHIVRGLFNLTDSIYIGNNSTIAGSGSEFWTHSFYIGKELSRVDGGIHIGDNCYIGSQCIFMPGIQIADNITIGAGSCVAKSLSEKGTYVNQGLRFIPVSADDAILKYGEPVCSIGSCKIYKKDFEK